MEFHDGRAPDWRDHAINEALRAEAESGEGLDALLRQIRLHRTGGATLATWAGPARPQLLRFLAARTTGCRSLLRDSAAYAETHEPSHPYVGWYAADWAGTPVEIALPPSTGGEGPAIYLGADEAALERFAAAVGDYTLRPLGRCLRYSSRWESAPDLDAEIGKVGWDDLVLPAETMAGVRGAVEGFVAHRDAYAALGFTWRRGILLIGPPGVGKTMVCKAAAAALADLPFLYVRDFREHGQREAVRTIFTRARKLAPCLLAFEDIDGLVTEDNRTVSSLRSE